MKRFLVVCAAVTLCCSLVHAQEAEDTGSGAVLSIVPRLDGGILYTDDEGAAFNFGNTSLYTLFEGSISPKWSFSICNHWAGSDYSVPARNLGDALFSPTADIYHFNRPFYGADSEWDRANFIDWAYITFSTGSWEFSAGKQTLMVGGFEFDEYDFDIDPFAASQLWNTLNVYKPAVSAAWISPSENHKFTLQWSAGLSNLAPYSLTLGWEGTFGPFSTRWSVMNTESPLTSNGHDIIISLGNRLELGSVTATLDWTNLTGDFNWYSQYIMWGHTFVYTLDWQLSDSWSVGLKGTFEYAESDDPYQTGIDSNNSWDNYPWEVTSEGSWLSYKDGALNERFSLKCDWQPLDWAKLHLSTGYNGIGGLYGLLGITCNIPVKLW